MNEMEIIKALEFQRIIHKMREYQCFACHARDKDGIGKGFKWLMKQLDDRKMREKQSAKRMSVQLSQNEIVIDLNKYGPTVDNPKCCICDIECNVDGSYCSVCGKWYCDRHKLTKMLIRKSGAKCKFCVGMKSRFGIESVEHKRKRSQTK